MNVNVLQPVRSCVPALEEEPCGHCVHAHAHAHASFISTTTKPLPDLATNTDYDTLTMTAFHTTPICNLCQPGADVGIPCLLPASLSTVALARVAREVLHPLCVHPCACFGRRALWALCTPTIKSAIATRCTYGAAGSCRHTCDVPLGTES